MDCADFNWDMIDASAYDLSAPSPSSDSFSFFDPSAMLPSSEIAAQFEMLVSEFSLLDSVAPLAFQFDSDDAPASAYDSGSTASTVTVRSRAQRSTTATAATTSGRLSREECRKTKQRRYEKNYRGRVRERRNKEEEAWIELEREFRKLLLKRATVIPRPRQSGDDDRTPNFDLCVCTATNLPTLPAAQNEAIDGLRRQLVELQSEEVALRYHAAYYKCLLAWAKALNFWGGQTDANRRTREQINALPSLQRPRLLEFEW